MLILSHDGNTIRLLNNNKIIGTDFVVIELINNNIQSAPWNGDSHLVLANYFNEHPEHGVTVVRATEQAPYNFDVVY
jgi:hypothetical protein